jgi:hypothetical protein
LKTPQRTPQSHTWSFLMPHSQVNKLYLVLTPYHYSRTHPLPTTYTHARNTHAPTTHHATRTTLRTRTTPHTTHTQTHASTRTHVRLSKILLGYITESVKSFSFTKPTPIQVNIYYFYLYIKKRIPFLFFSSHSSSLSSFSSSPSFFTSPLQEV